MSKICPNAKFCSVPFHELIYTSQLNYAVCCVMKDTGKLVPGSEEIETHWNSEQMRSLRQRLLAGEDTPECEPCWHDESNGKTSQRHRRNRRYYGQDDIRNHEADKFPEIKRSIEYASDNNGVYYKNDLRALHISVGNKCQLRCIHCSPAYSRAILKDYEKLGWDKNKKTKRLITSDRQNSEEAHWANIKKNALFTRDTLSIIRLTGGEPSINPHCLDFLHWCAEQGIAPAVEILVSTNIVNIKDKFIEALKPFHKVMLSISIDGIGELEEYIRYPENWAKKEQEVHRLSKMFPDSGFHTVINSLNVLQIDQIYNWSKQFSLYHNIEMIDYPEELSIRHLPDDLKEIAIDKINQIERVPVKYDMINNGLNGVLARLGESRNPEQWVKCEQIISGYDTIRKKPLKEIVTEFQKIG